MSLIALVLVLAFVGFGLWALNRFAGPYIDGKILTIINIVVVVAVVLWLLQVFGLFDSLPDIRVPRARSLA